MTDASPSSSENFNQGGIDSYIFTDHRSGLIMQCAQEILSLFILSIAAKVKSVGGETVYQDHAREEKSRLRDATRVARSLENSVFLELAREVVDAGRRTRSSSRPLRTMVSSPIGPGPMQKSTEPPRVMPRRRTERQLMENIRTKTLTNRKGTQVDLDGCGLEPRQRDHSFSGFIMMC